MGWIKEKKKGKKKKRTKENFGLGRDKASKEGMIWLNQTPVVQWAEQKTVQKQQQEWADVPIFPTGLQMKDP